MSAYIGAKPLSCNMPPRDVGYPLPVPYGEQVLPAGLVEPTERYEVQQLNTTDILVDPAVAARWGAWEARNQQPAYDTSIAYGTAIAAALQAQDQDFYIGEDPFHPNHSYLNDLQQVPGSMWKVDDESFDPWRTPQVVNRYAYLPRAAAQWAVGEMNKKMREEHVCFSLAQSEHFEKQYPPQNCGDARNPKTDPIVLIRVFSARVKYTPAGQEIYMSLEMGNFITGGAGGMFAVTVYTDKKGNFVHYDIDRDRKQEFVLPRSREFEKLIEKPWAGAGSIHGT